MSEADLEGKTAEEVEMMKTMGFCGFDTTKGKKVEGNNKGEVHVILKRKYRWVSIEDFRSDQMNSYKHSYF